MAYSLLPKPLKNNTFFTSGPLLDDSWIVGVEQASRVNGIAASVNGRKHSVWLEPNQKHTET
jgi:hypothetical protein